MLDGQTEATQVEQGNVFAEISNEVLNESKATPGQAKAVQPKATAEDILRSLDSTMTNAQEVQGEETEEVSEEVTEESEEAEVESTESDEELIDIVYKGSVEPLPKSEVIKLAQMGKDYTQKTQLLAAEKQKFQADFQQKTQEIEAMKNEFQNKMSGFAQEKESFDKLKFAFDVLKNQNPDLFNEMDNAVAQVLNQYDNPMIRQRIDMYDQKSKMLEDRLNQLTDNEIRVKYSNEEASLKAELQDKLASIGVIPDWTAVKKAYAEGGYPTVKAALLSVHGEEIVAGNQSKAKLDAVRKQAARVPVKPALKTASKSVKPATNISGMSFGDITSQLMKELNIG